VEKKKIFKQSFIILKKSILKKKKVLFPSSLFIDLAVILYLNTFF